MRRSLLALVTVLAACGHPAPATPDARKVSDYLTVMRAVSVGRTDAELLDAGHAVCRLLDRGPDHSMWSLVATLQAQTGADRAAAVRVQVQAAVAAFCPQYADPAGEP